MNSDDDRLLKPDDPAPQYITTKGVAAILGVTPQTIRRWVSEPRYAGLGFPQPIRLHRDRKPDRNGATGRQTRFRFNRAEVEQWLESMREVRR